MLSRAKKFKTNQLVLLSTLTLPVFSSYADWQVVPSIEAKLDAYDRRFDNGVEASDEVLTLTPKVNVLWDGNNLDGSFFASHDRIIPNSDEYTTARSYTNYGLSARSKFFSDMFGVNVQGSQNYVVRDAADSLSADRVTSPEQFSKVKRISGGVTFTLPNPAVFGLSAAVQASKTDSEAIEGQGYANLNSDNRSANIRFYSGKNIHIIDWNLSLQYMDTEREVSNDFTSTNVNAKISVPLSTQFRVVLTGKDERNELGSNNSDFADAFDQTSYGAGVEWFVSDSRFITVTYNKIEKTLNDQEEEFVGLDMKWAFSSRTAIDANYGKRFYGDSYAFNLTHGNRQVRTVIGYQESITSYSRIRQGTVDNTIVCPVGEAQFENCFQPDIGYELLPGEQSFDFPIRVPELSEEVRLRKSGNIAISWSRRKLTIGLSARKGSIDYIETNRHREDQSFGLNSSYKLSRTTNINFSANIAEYQYDTDINPDKSRTVALGLSKSLGRNIETSINVRYLDRESDELNRSLTDRRLTAGMTYKF